MERSMRLFSTAFLFLLLVATGMMGPMVAEVKVTVQLFARLRASVEAIVVAFAADASALNILSSILIPTAFVFLLLLVATGTMVAEGRTCESQSNPFKGTCVSKSNCVVVCQIEGFPGGQCCGLCRRFFCTRHC
ncbi:unnamed protein product [Malus baccata var. baccata]